MRNFSVPDSSRIAGEPGEKVVCIVPYKEATAGFQEGECLQVQTARGPAVAVMEDWTQVLPPASISHSDLTQAGFQTAEQAAESCNNDVRDLVAVLRFRIDRLVVSESGRPTLLQKVKGLLGW